MPEFTYEESDNYLLAEMASAASDGKLKHDYFECLRGIKECGIDSGSRLWLDILTTELEERKLIVDGRIVNKSK